jgi:hypothetical protein
MNRPIQFRTIASACLIGLAVAAVVWPGFLPIAQAVIPAPDGGYANGNTAEGTSALFSLNGGLYNTAVGLNALYTDTTGGRNTATGVNALRYNVTGASNTAVGVNALYLNTASFNTAIGDSALFHNTIGEANTANGYYALFSNTTGNNNTANGFQALFSNTSGERNTAIGNGALYFTTGRENTAIGDGALSNSTIGNFNTALGSGAGLFVHTATGVIAIGNEAADVSGTAWFGNVYGVGTQSGTTLPVIVSNQGQLGTIASSERFKRDIATMDKASEMILCLRPVTFHYKSDAKGIEQFGLIAEEVAKVNRALVVPDKEGKPYSVRYDAINVMLLNEFLKEHRKNEEQEVTIARQQKQIEGLTAGLQKVSAKLATGRVRPTGGLEVDRFAAGRTRRGGSAAKVAVNDH